MTDFLLDVPRNVLYNVQRNKSYETTKIRVRIKNSSNICNISEVFKFLT